MEIGNKIPDTEKCRLLTKKILRAIWAIVAAFRQLYMVERGCFLFLSPTITRGFLWAKLNQNDDLSSIKISSQVTEKTSVF